MSPASSFASLCLRRLIHIHCTTRLGCDNPPATAAAHFLALDRRRSFASSGLRRGIRETGSSGGGAGGRGRPAAGFSTWARLAIGSTVAIAAPFLHSKSASILRIGNEVEMVKDAAETAAEVVEEVATAAERVSSEVAGHLPEDGRLRRAAVAVEHASKEVAEEAHLARDIIHKVDEIEEDVKAIIEPIMDHGKHERKHLQK
ncbi:uncharacterized protein LOC119311563 [Triticum dicoccoides]|uniref:uncharacterized protein LOC119311563 n=1 Tax=Triticum dicoccoides TaxID=85692 RepID=UPI0003D559E3|nr:uncharacterized protein LOC119311563 [Triticum dicoccoides]XP_044376321.1 uncharacterized protein LOC123098405 [Triticum aestivum]